MNRDRMLKAAVHIQTKMMKIKRLMMKALIGCKEPINRHPYKE